jgi:hypothetical protein
MSGGSPYATVSTDTLNVTDTIIENAEGIRSQIYVVIQNPWAVLTGNLKAPIQISAKDPEPDHERGVPELLGRSLTDAVHRAGRLPDVTVLPMSEYSSKHG